MRKVGIFVLVRGLFRERQLLKMRKDSKNGSKLLFDLVEDTYRAYRETDYKRNIKNGETVCRAEIFITMSGILVFKV